MNDDRFNSFEPGLFAAYATETGAVLIETYRVTGGIEELYVLPTPTKPSAHNDHRCDNDCECDR